MLLVATLTIFETETNIAVTWFFITVNKVVYTYTVNGSVNTYRILYSKALIKLHKCCLWLNISASRIRNSLTNEPPLSMSSIYELSQ